MGILQKVKESPKRGSSSLMIIHSNFLSFQIGGIRVPKNVIIVCIGAGDVLGRFSSFVAILPNLRLESHE